MLQAVAGGANLLVDLKATLKLGAVELFEQPGPRDISVARMLVEFMLGGRCRKAAMLGNHGSHRNQANNC